MTLGQKSSKLNNRPVYCLGLYGNCLTLAHYGLETPFGLLQLEILCEDLFITRNLSSFFFSSSIQNWAEDLISGNTTTGRILVVFAFTCSMVSFVLYIISKSFSYLYKLRYLKREVGPDRC